jgi:hypothetical protein
MRISCLILIILSVTASGTLAQGENSGCTDPAASNFDANARINDGTCRYPATRIDPRQLSRMPAGLEEQSGMIWWDDLFWMHNDGGHPPVLFALDSSGTSVKRRILLKGATNIDWEDMAQDADYLYVADAGNNSNGARQDLCIYRVRKEALRDTSAAFSVDAEKIEFRFEDQPWPPLTQPANTTDFDVEAMIVRDGKIHLFTKQWTGKKTTIYTLEAAPGKQQLAKKSGTFDSEGLVTGATMDPTGEVIVLTGYTPLLSRFIWILYDFKGDDFFGGNRRLVRLSGAGQTESACFTEPDRLFIGSERFRILPDRMESLWLGDLLTPFREQAALLQAAQ